MIQKFILLGLIVGWNLTGDHIHFPEHTCIKTSTIVEIVAVNYRTATVKLIDGSTKDLDQPTIKAGDKICLEYN